MACMSNSAKVLSKLIPYGVFLSASSWSAGPGVMGPEGLDAKLGGPASKQEHQ